MTRASNRAAFKIYVVAAIFLVAVEPAANGVDSSRSIELGREIFRQYDSREAKAGPP
ncbi:hypothetical protein HDG33_003291 [Paraburkholderia sp. Cpub6]|nr:hypothetical protein [Paraburkholderia sp. Cpub6]